MCGRYTSIGAFDELALQLGITLSEGTKQDVPARYNVAPME